LNDSVERLPYVGVIYAKRLRKLGIKNINDLLYHFPHRYRDFSKKQKIKNLVAGSESSIEGKVIEANIIRTKTRKTLVRVAVTDGSGAIEAVWFNQPYLLRTLKKGTKVGLAGKVEPFGGRISFISPEFEILEGNSSVTHTAGLIPMYPETARVSSKWIRSRIKNIVNKLNKLKVEEFMPKNILDRYAFPEIQKAFLDIHFPKNLKDAGKARDRFAFEELLLLNLRSLKRKSLWKQKNISIRLSYTKHKDKIDRFMQDLPFNLTKAQRKAIGEILSDLEKIEPMNRLLEGDVGSGKTVVAAVASYLTHLCGAKAIFMAPTEILADQHLRTLKNFLEPKGVKIAIHTGTKKPKTDEDFDLWVGTHSLFYKSSSFKDVGLVVIDEQHKFGVEQRSKLLGKAKTNKVPHLLTLTATPIPRTLALTVYGDLDISILDEIPPGRKEVKTFVVPEEKRLSSYSWVGKRIKEGDQAFVICPLIEESEKESMQQVKAANVEYEKLKKVYPGTKIGLLHGRLKAKEKDQVMESFRRGKTKILVSTPVVEVGIDIPNATIMIVEAAERFGLAALHQLRGRVGRGEKDSYFFLFSENTSPSVLTRLKALEKTSNGFDLAELDLKLRGPGEIYGTRQHGLAGLKIADFTNVKMLKETRDAAEKLAPDLDRNHLLAKKLNQFSSSLVEPN